MKQYKTLEKKEYLTIDGKMKHSQFLDFLQVNRDAIKNEIFKFVPVKAEIQKEDFGLHHHREMLAEYPDRGGKYVRPGLVLLSTFASGARVDNALTTAAAMEVSEDWILIHDDFEDHSLERRGKPSLPMTFGDELAVNAGDHLHMIMWDILLANRDSLGPSKTFMLFDEMNSFLQKTCEGQYLELSWNQGKKFITEEEYYAMVDRKTGWYTIIGPLRLGAIVADNMKALEPLVDFGIPLGRAFQIHDDWLNVFSTKTGKELGGDILEGKRTLLLVKLMSELSDKNEDEHLAWVKNIYSVDRSQRDFFMTRHLIELYEEFGVREWVREKAKTFAEEAKVNLNEIPNFSVEGLDILRDATDFLVNREL